MNKILLISLIFIFNITADDQTNEINILLDGLHEDAHKGNYESYFKRYTSDAFFLGTDKTERWSIDEFKAYAEPAFADGRGWTYKVVDRNIEGEGNIRWFDEIVFNKKLGHCRGTGVVQFINGEWKIAHYALTMLIPNSVAEEVGSKSRAADTR